MSAVFKATLEEKEFDIKITRDGELVFLDYDIECDFLRAELGETATPAMKLANEWIEDPIEFIVDIIQSNYPNIVKEISIPMAIDFVEHILPAYEKGLSLPFESSILRHTIKFARTLADTDGIGRKKLYEYGRRLLKESEQAYKVSTGSRYFPPEYAAAWAGYTLTRHMLSYYGYTAGQTEDLYGVSNDCAIVMIKNRTKGKSFIEDKKDEGYQGEISWQVRRFVDVMECLQDAKPWPPFEDTK